jgi:hypothetical protein
LLIQQIVYHLNNIRMRHNVTSCKESINQYLNHTGIPNVCQPNTIVLQCFSMRTIVLNRVYLIATAMLTSMLT